VHDGNSTASCPAQTALRDVLTFRAFHGRSVSCIISVGCGELASVSDPYDFISDEVQFPAGKPAADADWELFSSMVAATQPNIKLFRIQAPTEPTERKSAETFYKSLDPKKSQPSSLFEHLEATAKKCSQKFSLSKSQRSQLRSLGFPLLDE
jgi:hypothetical protein